MPTAGRTAPPGNVRVDVRGLTKTFGSVRAVSDLSFTVEPASVTGFLGPNGAGKTTTLRMVLGLEKPDAGTATFGGSPYAGLAEPLSTVGAVLETAFHPARSGRDHLRVYCRAAGLPMARVDAVLAQVGLTEAGERRAGGYSLGMRQRLALATALLGDPAVLVLDEPANGLDHEGIQWLRGFLRFLAHALVGIPFAVLTIGVGVAVVEIYAGARGAAPALTGDNLRVVAGSGAALIVYAVIGVGLGALMRNQVGAIIAALVYLRVAEPLIGAIGATAPAYKFLPGGALQAMTATIGGPQLLHPWQGGLLLLGYGLLAALLGILFTVRRDVL